MHYKAIVSGHSRGLGHAIAAELLGRGIPVLGLARAGAAQLKAAFPALFQEVPIDLADSAALARWLAGDTLTGWLQGHAALLVNNAGMVEPVGAPAQQDPAEVARAVALNVAAPLMLAAAVAACSSQARILHVSSGAGRGAYPGWSVYCATKAALDMHARAMAQDGMRVCSLAPGVIDTAMQAAIRATPLARFPGRERFEALHRDGQLSAPADCARRLASYLLAPQFGAEPVADLRDG